MSEKMRQQQGFTLIELMIVIAIIGILAAVALPAYQDYAVRSKVSEGINLAAPLKQAVTIYRNENSSWPTNNASMGVSDATDITGNYVTSVGINGAAGAVRITYSSAEAEISGGTIDLTPTDATGSIKWVCTSSIAAKYLPGACR